MRDGLVGLGSTNCGGDHITVMTRKSSFSILQSVILICVIISDKSDNAGGKKIICNFVSICN